MATDQRDRSQRFIDGFLTVWETLKPPKDPEPSNHMIQAYERVLAPYNIIDIEKAFAECLHTMKWFPKPVELIYLIRKSLGAIGTDARAQQQWRIVTSAVRRLGSRRRPKFADPITENLVRTQFTWSYLCDMYESRENWEQKRWCEAFDLASSIHKDLVEIEGPKKVFKLLGKIGHEMIEDK